LHEALENKVLGLDGWAQIDKHSGGFRVVNFLGVSVIYIYQLLVSLSRRVCLIRSKRANQQLASKTYRDRDRDHGRRAWREACQSLFVLGTQLRPLLHQRAWPNEFFNLDIIVKSNWY
jgi:hypothetical protein